MTGRFLVTVLAMCVAFASVACVGLYVGWTTARAVGLPGGTALWGGLAAWAFMGRLEAWLLGQKSKSIEVGP